MSEFYGVVYQITCQVNGKRYVGQTTVKDPLKYIQGHFNSAMNGGRKLLYNAIRKYGANNFTFEIIWWAIDKVSLDISEDSFIKLFETMAPNGYNLRGGGSHGKHSEISKASIVAALAKPETIEKRARSNADPIVRNRHRVGTKAALAIPEIKARQKAGLNKPEVRQKILAGIIDTKWINNGQKNRKLKNNEILPEGWAYGRFGYITDTSPEATERRSAAAKLSCERPEVLAAKVVASNIRWSKPGAHEHASETSRTALARPEAKEKRAATEADPAFKSKRRETTIVQMSDPIFLADHAARMTAVMNDPIVAARHKAAYERPETKTKLSEIAVGTIWINNGEDSRRIQKTDPLPSGWTYGSIYMHTRWHVRRGIKSPDCPLCNAAVPKE